MAAIFDHHPPLVPYLLRNLSTVGPYNFALLVQYCPEMRSMFGIYSSGQGMGDELDVGLIAESCERGLVRTVIALYHPEQHETLARFISRALPGAGWVREIATEQDSLLFQFYPLEARSPFHIPDRQ